MFRRDAGPKSRTMTRTSGTPSPDTAEIRETMTLPPDAPYFQRIFDQVLEQPQQLLAIARDRHRRIRQIEVDDSLGVRAPAVPTHQRPPG